MKWCLLGMTWLLHLWTHNIWDHPHGVNDLQASPTLYCGATVDSCWGPEEEGVFVCLFIYYLFDICVCACACLYVPCACRCHGNQKRISDPQELELQEVENHLIWVLGTEPGSSAQLSLQHTLWFLASHSWGVSRDFLGMWKSRPEWESSSLGSSISHRFTGLLLRLPISSHLLDLVQCQSHGSFNFANSKLQASRSSRL